MRERIAEYWDDDFLRPNESDESTFRYSFNVVFKIKDDVELDIISINDAPISSYSETIVDDFIEGNSSEAIIEIDAMRLYDELITTDIPKEQGIYKATIVLSGIASWTFGRDDDAYDIDDVKIDNMNISVDKLEKVDIEEHLEMHKDKIKPSVREVHGKVKESLENEDGWSEEIVDILEPPIEEVEELAYELRNTVRGAKTGVDDVDGLIDHCEHIMSRLDDAIDDLEDNSDDLNEDYDEDRYEKIRSKSVYDYDGFTTDYTLYFDHNENNYFTVFGDNDLYGPEDSDHDWDFGPNEDEALEWFDDYEGFVDDLDVDLELTDDDLEAGQWYESLNEAEYIAPKYKDGDLVFVGDAQGYNGSCLIHGDISKIPQEAYKAIRRITKWGNVPDLYYMETKLQSEHHFEDDWKNFYDWIDGVFQGSGIEILKGGNDEAIRRFGESLNETLGVRAVSLDEVLKEAEELAKDLLQTRGAKEQRENYARDVYYTYARELKAVPHKGSDGRDYVYTDANKNHYKINLKYIPSAMRGNLASWYANAIKVDDISPIEWQRAVDKMIKDKFVEKYEVLDESLREGLLFRDNGAGLANKGYIFTLQELGKIYDDSVKAKDPVVMEYKNFSDWMNDTVDSGLLEIVDERVFDESCNEKLIQSSSDKAFKKNVATEIKAGKDPKQAVAIAYSVKRKNESVDDGWEEVSGRNGYKLFRKIVDGRGKWKAQKVVKGEPVGEPFDITYAQALGREPIEDKPIAELSKKLGKVLLPKREGIKESFGDEDFQQKLKNELQGKLQYHYKRLGYTPREIEDYIMPVYKTELRKGYGDDGSNALFIWVGAEVDYDELEELANVLNKVIRKYDKDAYFEPETSGRLISVLWD